MGPYLGIGLAISHMLIDDRRMTQSLMRENKEFLLGQYQRHEQSVKSGNYVSLLMVLTYLTAIGIALSIGNVKSGNDLDLLVILVMLVAALPLLRNGNTLNQTSRTTCWSSRLRTTNSWRLRRHKTKSGQGGRSYHGTRGSVGGGIRSRS